jgi:hypothetical protein
MEEAYEIRAETWFDRGFEMAQAITPKTAYASEVKLRWLRWYVGKLGPRRFGNMKPMDAPKPAEPPQHTTWKTFWLETGPDGEQKVRARWYDHENNRIEGDVPGDWGPAPARESYRPPSHGGPEPPAAPGETARAAREIPYDPTDPEGWT